MRLLLLLLIPLIFGCLQAETQPAAPASAQPPSGNAAASNGTTTNPQGDATSPPATVPPTASTSLKSEGVEYPAGAWEIHGTLYESKNGEPTKAIILAHMLGEDRTSYPISFIEDLHGEVPDALILAIDLRGHGESTNIGTYDKLDTSQFMDMRNDILGAKPMIEDDYPTVKEYYVVGASIGSTAAIMASRMESDINKLALISPGMEYKGVDITRAADDYSRDLLLVASSGDSYSVSAASQIEGLSPSTHITKKIYGGSAHGTDLFDATKSDAEPLDRLLIDFLKD